MDDSETKRIWHEYGRRRTQTFALFVAALVAPTILALVARADNRMVLATAFVVLLATMYASASLFFPSGTGNVRNAGAGLSCSTAGSRSCEESASTADCESAAHPPARLQFPAGGHECNRLIASVD